MLAQSFRIDFDPLNVLAMSLVAEEKRLRRDREFLVAERTDSTPTARHLWHAAKHAARRSGGGEFLGSNWRSCAGSRDVAAAGR